MLRPQLRDAVLTTEALILTTEQMVLLPNPVVGDEGRGSGCQRFCSGSLALTSLDHTCRDHRPDFSATLTTTAFDRSSLRWFGIGQPNRRIRRVLLHLQYSYAAPFGPALLVTQGTHSPWAFDPTTGSLREQTQSPWRS
jgi:hypothetical protein